MGNNGMGLSFLSTGAAARKLVASNEAQIKRRKEEREKQVHRFWVKRGGERRITFLDGTLMDDGQLDVVTYYEHNLYLNGNWRNWFVCTQSDPRFKGEPCPICEEGHLPAMVAAFTIIDHTTFTDREGKSHKDQTMLLIAKRQTRLLLEHHAVKREGLAGVTFDVARVDEDQSAAVGTMFDFVTKNPVSKLKKKFKTEVIDYLEALNFKTPDELRAEGFGTSDKIGDEADTDDDDDIEIGTAKAPMFGDSPEDKGEDEDDDDDLGIDLDDGIDLEDSI